jgi:hypothetical protein
MSEPCDGADALRDSNGPTLFGPSRKPGADLLHVNLNLDVRLSERARSGQQQGHAQDHSTQRSIHDRLLSRAPFVVDSGPLDA